MGFSSISSAFRRRIHSYHTSDTHDKFSKPLDPKYQDPSKIDQRSSLTNLLSFKRKNDDFDNSTSGFFSKGSLDSLPKRQEQSKSGPVSLQDTTPEEKEILPPTKPKQTQTRTSGFLGLRRLKKTKSRRPRLKDLSSSELIDSLADGDPKLAPRQAANVTTMLSCDDVLLGDLIHVVFVQQSKLATSPHSDSSLSTSSLSDDLPNPADENEREERKAAKEPRSRFRRAWIVATLILHGSSDLMTRIANHRPHVHALASVFDVSPSTLDPILAFHTADIFRGLIHSYPKQIADALRGTKIISRLIEHLPSQAAEDLLPRFIATKMFTSITPPPLIPSHKRSIAMMGSSTIQEKLANKFVYISKDLLSLKLGKESSRHAVATIDSVARTMAEISVRAMGLRRKREDSDERNDTVYAGNLGLVTAHVYNDAKDHMDLLRNTQPLQTVIDIAFGQGRNNNDILLAAICLFTRVLQGLRELRHAPLPTLRKVVEGFIPTTAGNILVKLRDELIKILENGRPVVGRDRLAIVDLINESCAVCEEDILEQLVCANNYTIMKQLISLGTKFLNNDILHNSLGHTLENIFDRSEKITRGVISNTCVLELLLKMKQRNAYHKALSVLITYKQSNDIGKGLEDDSRLKLDQLEEYYETEIGEIEAVGLLKQPQMAHMKSKPDISFDWTNLDTDTVHEDYGQELYLRRLLQESSIDFDADPSHSLNMEHSVGAITQGLQEGLTHLFHHDDDEEHE